MYYSKLFIISHTRVRTSKNESLVSVLFICLRRKTFGFVTKPDFETHKRERLCYESLSSFLLLIQHQTS